MKNKEKFYNEKVKIGKVKQRGFFGFLFERLEKHAVNRQEAALEILPKKFNKILDVGSGDGKFLFSLSERIFHKGFGIDISSLVVKEANKQAKDRNLARKIVYKIADLDESLSFATGSFDVVTCLAVLEHVFDPLFVFKELARVTKPGGNLIVEVPNLAWLPRRLALLFGQRPRTSWGTGWDGGHLQYFTLSDLRQLFKEQGFVIEKEICSGVFARFRTWWLTVLSADLIIVGRKIKQ